jgi:fatty-acyl-CoA synthase
VTEASHIPQLTLHDYETNFAERHLLQGVVNYWAARRPDAAALLSADGGRRVSWSEFDRMSAALASELLRLGFRRGDYLVTQLPMSVDHVLLEYGCFRIGVIVAPLDLRLTAAEVARALEILRPRGYVFPGAAPPLDFRAMYGAVKERCPWIEHSIAMDQAAGLDGAIPFSRLAEPAGRAARAGLGEADEQALAAAGAAITADDGALVIFTTGSTGSPKPALLSHRNITVQNMCLCAALFDGDHGMRTLVNLPASHVGGQSEVLMTTLFGGGTAVLLEIFDAGRTLRAVEEHGVELLGQIPAMFNLEWMLKDYARYDLTSLRFAAYGGTAVSRPFVEKLATMAPLVGTGLGNTS